MLSVTAAAVSGNGMVGTLAALPPFCPTPKALRVVGLGFGVWGLGIRV